MHVYAEFHQRPISGRVLKSSSVTLTLGLRPWVLVGFERGCQGTCSQKSWWS